MRRDRLIRTGIAVWALCYFAFISKGADLLLLDVLHLILLVSSVSSILLSVWVDPTPDLLNRKILQEEEAWRDSRKSSDEEPR